MSTMVVYAVVALVCIAVPFILHHIDKNAAHPLDISLRQLISQNLTYFITLYAFILSFSMITLWGIYQNAETTVTKEAELALNMYRLSPGLPNSGHFRHLLTDYVRTVKEEEWKEMDKGVFRAKMDSIDDRLWAELNAIRPQSPEYFSIFNNLIVMMTDMGEQRLERLLLLDGSLYPQMWALIYLGGFLSLFGLFFTSTGQAKVQFISDFMLICMIVFTIYLIYELDSPFSGNLHIDPKAFNMVYDKMMHLGAQVPK
ncbi:MAG: hypothetical protein QG555_1297 [Thermodesulfobacteriota bacterium]|nr:hypothetical protein [Thermodesulfobacteriota bacterium]